MTTTDIGALETTPTATDGGTVETPLAANRVLGRFAATGAAMFGKVTASGAGAFRSVTAVGSGLLEKVSSASKCPSCKSMDIARTDASGVFEDAYKCKKCNHEFTAIGPAAGRRIVRAGVKTALVVGWVVGAVIESL